MGPHMGGPIPPHILYASTSPRSFRRCFRTRARPRPATTTRPRWWTSASSCTARRGHEGVHAGASGARFKDVKDTVYPFFESDTLFLECFLSLRVQPFSENLACSIVPLRGAGGHDGNKWVADMHILDTSSASSGLRRDKTSHAAM